MTEKLEDFRKQLEELDSRLSDPEIMKDMKEFRKVSVDAAK